MKHISFDSQYGDLSIVLQNHVDSPKTIETVVNNNVITLKIQKIGKAMICDLTDLEEHQVHDLFLSLNNDIQKDFGHISIDGVPCKVQEISGNCEISDYLKAHVFS